MAKTTGRREQRRCECGASLPAYGASRCTSCRYHAGEPDAVEQSAAERAADREVARSDKALRQKYRTKSRGPVAQSPKDGMWYVVYKGRPIAGPYDTQDAAEQEAYRLMSINQMGS